MTTSESLVSKWSSFHRAVVAALSVATLVVVLMPGSFADEMDKKTIVTFNTPVEVPGKALPAGTYVFKLLDSAANRNIVQIYDKDEKHLLATMLAIPDYRLTPSDKPVIMFEERPSGTPPALKAWFYPGDTFGQQFVYPHKRAVELAKRTNQNVLSMRDDMTRNMATKATSASNAGIHELQQTDVSGVDASGEPVAITVIIAEKPQE